MSLVYDFEIEELKRRMQQLEGEFDAYVSFQPTVKFKKLVPEAVVPKYQTDGAAGIDLVGLTAVTIHPGHRAIISTGLSVELPQDWEAQVRPRSGGAARHGLTVLNTPGTIDADYRGEVKVLLVNLGQRSVEIPAGERIAQLVIARASQAVLVEVEELSTTDRGAGGFGSTGK